MVVVVVGIIGGSVVGGVGVVVVGDCGCWW